MSRSARAAPIRSELSFGSVSDTSDETLARRRIGGRVDHTKGVPDEGGSYRDLSPAERMAAMRRLSRRVFATKLASEDGERGHSGLPDRLVGGRR